MGSMALLKFLVIKSPSLFDRIKQHNGSIIINYTMRGDICQGEEEIKRSNIQVFKVYIFQNNSAKIM